jgi:Ser/Thr protein kinase RdoA (MazF antagonist)
MPTSGRDGWSRGVADPVPESRLVSARTRVIRIPRPSRVSTYVTSRFRPPAIDPDSVRRVLDGYALRPTGGLNSLGLGRRSRNVVVMTNGGRRVLKLYRPQWTSETVRYGHSILEHLERLGFPAPRLERTRRGATWVAKEGRLFAVFGYLPGINYSLNYLRRDDRRRLATVAGRTLASLHRALDGFEPQGAHHLGFRSLSGPRRRDLAWHVGKLEELPDRSVELADPELKRLAKQLASRAGWLLEEISALDPALSQAGLPRLVVHGDYGIHNLLYQRSGRVIPVDFELSRLDWRLNDLISAMVKYRRGGEIFDLASMETFMWAYAAEFPLSEGELSHLPEAWRFYKLQQAVQYWNSCFEAHDASRRLRSALDSLEQAGWVEEHSEVIERLILVAAEAPLAAGRPRREPETRRALSWRGVR